MSKRLVACAFVMAVLATFGLAEAEETAPGRATLQHAYLDELIRQSAEKNLSEQRYWHLLLHYRWHPLWGTTSLADGPGFFLSTKGKTDPKAELEATLAKFFSDELVGTSQQQAQCAFPARYQWLNNQLQFDPDRLPERDCDRFKRWMVNLDPEFVTLVFPSAYMNSPSSMFGHTLLRIDQKGQTEQTRILAYVINYAAAVTSANGFTFALYGITGGFQGYFSIMPYYIKVQEYSEMENRDIWEYRLNLNHDQIERMLMHAWELGNTYFDYFFFKENCSYHLLSLLEVADPGLHLTDQFHGWTIPADTIRVVEKQPGLVDEIFYRPSRTTEIHRKREMLSPGEYDLLLDIVRDPANMDSGPFLSLPDDRKAFVLDTSYDYLRYRGVSDDEEKKRNSGAQQELLKARSRLSNPSEPPEIKPITGPPEAGHRTFRIGLGGGWRGEDSFEEISLRAAYHDLLDREEGYISGSQIEILNIQLRYLNEAEKVRLHRLQAINIVSLTPLDALFRKPSWKVSAGWETVPGTGLSGHRIFSLSAGVGGSLRTELWRSEWVYALAEAEGQYGRSFNPRYRAGGGGSAGLFLDLSSRWRFHLFARYLSFPAGDRSFDFARSVHQRFTLTTNLALRAELDRRNHQTQALLRLDFYL